MVSPRNRGGSMSDKLEQIKELQKDLFVEEYGVTKEQALKLNEFLFHEPTGNEFDFWAGRELPQPSVNAQLRRLEKKVDGHYKELSDLQWEHKKLWMSFWGYVILSITVIVWVVLQ
jgi:hypothetical protein